MRTNTQEAVLSAYIASIGKRTPRDAAQDAAELCRLANSVKPLARTSPAGDSHLVHSRALLLSRFSVQTMDWVASLPYRRAPYTIEDLTPHVRLDIGADDAE
jgi:hypothetical protein